jgi:hypothetical protein
MAEPLTAEDRLEIMDVIARYCWALDISDPDALAACFARAGALVWDTFDPPARFSGADALRRLALVFRDMPGAAGRQHHAASTVIEGDRSVARARSYVHVTHRQGDEPFPVRFAGWYEDRFIRQDGRWVIAERIIRDWAGPVLKAFPGQTGEKLIRPRPPGLPD